MNLLTVKQAAQLIHRRPQYVREMIRDGRLRAVRLTPRGQWLVDGDSLERLCGFSVRRATADDVRKSDEAALWRWK